MKVGLMFGGRSAEHLVSVRSAKTVAQGLAAAGHEVVPLGIAENGVMVDVPTAEDVLARRDRVAAPAGGDIRASYRTLLDADLEVVFPIVHGTYGEDGTLQGLLAMLDVPCVGASVVTSSVCMDKVLTKRVLDAAGIAVVPYTTIARAARDTALQKARDLGGPWFVKPAVGGSSVGCTGAPDEDALVRAVDLALRFDDVVLIEKSVKGRELECAVLGPRGDLSASCIGEIVPGGEFYDYADKYLNDTAQLHAPAPLSDEDTARLSRAAVRAFDAVAGSGMARVDFFLTDDALYVNEINTLPGFTSISMYPRLWGLSGLALPDLCDRLCRIAVDEHRAHAATQSAIAAFIDEVAGGG